MTFVMMCYSTQSKIPMNQMTRPVAVAAENTSSLTSSPLYARTDASSVEVQPLTDVFVRLDSIQPGRAVQCYGTVAHSVVIVKIYPQGCDSSIELVL